MFEYLNSIESSSFPHIVFVDLYMPNRIGWEILTELEKSFTIQLQNAEVYLLTSSFFEEETPAAFKPSFLHEVLTKPINEEKLIGIIKRINRKVQDSI